MLFLNKILHNVHFYPEWQCLITFMFTTCLPLVPFCMLCIRPGTNSLCQTQWGDEWVSILWILLPSHGYKQVNLVLHILISPLQKEQTGIELPVGYHVFSLLHTCIGMHFIPHGWLFSLVLIVLIVMIFPHGEFLGIRLHCLCFFPLNRHTGPYLHDVKKEFFLSYFH